MTPKAGEYRPLATCLAQRAQRHHWQVGGGLAERWREDRWQGNDRPPWDHREPASLLKATSRVAIPARCSFACPSLSHCSLAQPPSTARTIRSPGWQRLGEDHREDQHEADQRTARPRLAALSQSSSACARTTEPRVRPIGARFMCGSSSSIRSSCRVGIPPRRHVPRPAPQPGARHGTTDRRWSDVQDCGRGCGGSSTYPWSCHFITKVPSSRNWSCS